MIEESTDLSYNNQEDLTLIPIDLEFWVHCSNMQIWAENKYDSGLLHSNLSFPLLKELIDVDDPIAKKIFKDEIVKRFESGYIPVIESLLRRKYFKYLDNDELRYLIDILDELIKRNHNDKKKDELLEIKKEIIDYYF